MSMLKKLKSKLLYIVFGLSIGLINGFFGGGGGMVCVPVLEKLLKLDSKHSHATALAVIFPLCLFSGIVYIVRVNLDWSVFGIVCAGFVVGGIIGAYLLKRLNNVVIRIIFVLVVLTAGIKLLL